MKTIRIKKSISKRILKVILFVVGGFVMFMLILSTLFYFYRDKIASEILLNLNDAKKGEVSFNDISVNFFVHFPETSVHLHKLYYTDSICSDSILSRDTIAFIKDVYVSINLLDLAKGNITASKITIEDGSIFLKKYANGNLNITNALGITSKKIVQSDSIPKSDSLVKDPNTQEIADSMSGNSAVNVLLDKVRIKNLKVNYVEEESIRKAEIILVKLVASFDYSSGIIHGNANTSIDILEFSLDKKLSFNNKHLHLGTELVFNEIEQSMVIQPSKLSLGVANFGIKGNLILTENPQVDLKINGTDKDFSIFKIFLSESGVENVESGETYFSGTLKGSFDDRIPEMNFDFGFNDVKINLPGTDHNISDLILDGHFSSGVKADLSLMKLVINKLSGKLPEGYVNASFSVENLVNPSINLLWDFDADVTGFDEILNIGDIKNLKGRIKIYDELNGTYDGVNEIFTENRSESQILFDSLSFEIPEMYLFNNINGKVERSMDTIRLFDLNLDVGNSDFSINGNIVNLFSLVTSQEEEINAKLSIVSDTFDLPVFFAYDPRVGRSFPYQIIDINMDFLAHTTTTKLLDFDYNPEIEFSFNSLEATIDNLFPPVFIHEGNMLMTEKDKRLYLGFNEFVLDIADANIKTDVVYFSPADDPDFVNVDAWISNLNPAKVFYEEQDSVDGFINGNLDGFAHLDLKIGQDTIDYESVNFNTKELSYLTEKDTFNIVDLSIAAKNIHYFANDKSPLASLSGEIIIEADTISSNHFSLEEIYYDIIALNGGYTISPEKIYFFGKEGDGIFTIMPFADLPTYELKYSVSNFRLEKLLSNLMADTLVTGYMNLDLDVSLADDEDANVFSSLNGHIYLNGNDLILYGLDLDNLIKKYQRSQKFNLVDVGAVLVAGPFGLALTKGTELATLAVGNFGDSSRVTKVISEWDCVNGRLIMKDVAFSTEENRVAGVGWIDLATDSLDITIAVLDVNGCSILSQSVYGNLKEPEYSEIKIVKTVLAPITNLINGALGKDCEVFYSGQIAHPPRKKGKSENNQ